MANLEVIFFTGLTTGGLSCLAVQGGLLASSIAKQVEDDLLNTPPPEPETETRHRDIYTRGPDYVRALRELESRGLRRKRYVQALQLLKYKFPKSLVEPPPPAPVQGVVKKHTALPIALFLGAKLISYTLLGALLGAVGSILQLTPYMQAGLQIVIGVYMVGLAMHLLNVHPFFRHFVFQPPRFITRYIRRKSKNSNDDLVTPTFLGAMTVFIPCGITTAMMAVAVGTGNALLGALVMFTFILGTSPVFFSLAYTAAKIGARKQAIFLKFAAITVFVLGLVAIESGLNVAGSPISFAAFKQNIRESRQRSQAQKSQQASAASSNTPEEDNTLRLTATYSSYSPEIITAKAGKPYKLEITSQDNQGCGRSFTIPSLGMRKVLPENGVVTIDIPAQKKGSMRLTCSMGMYNARITFI